MKHAPRLAGYRPIPRDFADTFARVGWDGIEAELHAHKTTIKRWIDQYDAQADLDGGPPLHVIRRQWLERHYAENLGGKKIGGVRPGRAKRYVLGRTLSAVITSGNEG